MKNLLSGLVLSAACVGTTNAAQVLVNGGFETGNFSGWSAGSTQASPFQAALGAYPSSAIARNDSNTANAWFIKNNNSPYFGSTNPLVATPITGYSAFNGFDGSQGYFHLEQGFSLSGGPVTAGLAFDWGIQSNYSGLSRVFSVNLLNSSHALVSNLFAYTRPTGNLQNWAVSHTALDLDNLFSSLSAGNYFLQFKIDVPQYYTGPAQFALDNVSLDVTRNAVPEPTTLALIGLGLAGAGFARRRRSASSSV